MSDTLRVIKTSSQERWGSVMSGAPLGTILLVAVAYLIAAWMGKLLAPPGAFASPLWPAAGLALAILLKGGMRWWPGIWLGACAFMLLSTPVLAGLVPALLVATGATLQALLGARLVKPLCEQGNSLARERDVLSFLLLAGPLACLVAPSITTLALVVAGSLATPGEIAAQWLTLWTGDALGVVLFAPLVMLLWPGAQRLWADNRLRLALPLVTTAVLLTAGHVGLERLEESRRGEAAASYKEEVYRTGLLPLAMIFESVNGVERFFAASEEVNREEFATFTSSVIAKPEILGLDWAPRVPHENLAEFEAATRRAGMPDYWVFEPDAAGRPVPVRERPDHFPVRYSKPPAANAKGMVLGLDHAFEAARREAMDAARDSAACGLAEVPLLRTERRALLVFQPVYRQGFAFRSADAAARRAALHGYVVAVLDIERMFAPLQQAATAHRLAFRVTDVTPGETPKVLTDSLPTGHASSWSRATEIAGRSLRIEMAPLESHGTSGGGFHAYHFLALLAGLLVSFTTLTSTGRQAATDAEVVVRTAELEQSRRDAEQANLAKSAFLATMSHEIRTPMNGVLGMLEVLEHGNLTEHQRDQVQTMRDSAATLLALIDDILDFSKIEAGRIEFEHAPLSVADMVEGLCTSQLSVARRRGVELRMFVDPDLPERVLGDDTRLRQVLYNLVGNAIKFSAGNPARPGRVTVRATLAAHVPLRIAFMIEDNGIGMDAAMQARLFTPFTQAEASTTRRFGGTGLGLTICRRLVDLMGGEIAITSRPGAGSVFTVTLPVALAPEQPVREQPDLSGLVCCLLDDADIDAEALAAYLAHAGATVQRCADAEEAVRCAAAALSPMVLIHADDESRRWRDGELPAQLRRVRIGHGRRRRARLDAPDCVSIDGDALRRQAFLMAVAVAAGRASPEVFDDRSTDVLPGETIPPPTVAQARAENRLILVAEDDSVNQKVVLQQLALLGYAAEVTGDGAEALARWQDGGFALLFTDLHMPEMDGYQLAAEIRRLEEGGHRLPIIALTANALRGEAARAKAAGMDDYLTKPVALARLREVLEAWLPRAKVTAAATDQAPAAAPGRALDVAVLQGLVGDDPAVLKDFLVDYARTVAQAATELRAAAAVKDHAQLAAIAHKLKSSSRSVGALPLGDLCAELENAGKRNDGPAVTRCMAQFETLFAAVEKELAPLLSEEKTT
ncbi:MAG: CHASE domain-containing protein [Rhodocyclaceae bacterium]|nr:CHASE domain-containing protein [Rhodocyclaceae bacterium]MDZ4215409.1 CHASE domain-containing protein [Rhodocyclaceae bacterium]